MQRIFYSLILQFVVLVPISCNANEPTGTSNGNVNESVVFGNPHVLPVYINGGEDGLFNDLYSVLMNTAPVGQENIQGRAVVSFVISEEGVIDPNSIRVIKNKDVPDDYMNAAIEAIKSLGKFEPGKMNGTPKNVRYSIPVKYPVPINLIKTSE